MSNEQKRNIAGAVFDFASFLTTRDKPTAHGGNELCGSMIVLLEGWFANTCLDIDDDPNVSGWQSGFEKMGDD